MTWWRRLRDCNPHSVGRADCRDSFSATLDGGDSQLKYVAFGHFLRLAFSILDTSASLVAYHDRKARGPKSDSADRK